VASLWEKNSWWAKFSNNCSKKVGLAPWMEEGLQNWKLWCVMDSKHNKCVSIVEWRQSRWLWCGAQGVN